MEIIGTIVSTFVATIRDIAPIVAFRTSSVRFTLFTLEFLS